MKSDTLWVKWAAAKACDDQYRHTFLKLTAVAEWNINLAHIKFSSQNLIILYLSILHSLPIASMEIGKDNSRQKSKLKQEKQGPNKRQKAGTPETIYPVVQLTQDYLEKNPYALHEACQERSYEKARLLINAGANVNDKDKDDLTPLHRATKYARTETVQFLLEHGADVNAKDKDGLAPLHMAAYLGRKEIAMLLLEHGANVNAEDQYGLTPLHKAAYLGPVEIARILLEHRAMVNAKDQYSRTPLHWAAKYCALLSLYGRTETPRVLLEHGADVNAKDKDGLTPLHMAVVGGRTEIAQLLLSRFHFSQPALPTTAEFTYADGKQDVWDLKSLVLMNILNNIEDYDEEELRNTMQTYPTLVTNYKKILPFVDLTNKKIRSLLAIANTTDLADYCTNKYLEQITKLIEMQNNAHETALDTAKKLNNKGCIRRLLEAVKNAGCYEQLPEEIKQIAIYLI